MKIDLLLSASRLQKDKLETLKHVKAAERIPPPYNKVSYFMYTVAVHVMFDVVMYTLIIINMVPIILELASDDDASYMDTLSVINYVYCAIYVTEVIWKVGNRCHVVPGENEKGTDCQLFRSRNKM